MFELFFLLVGLVVGWNVPEPEIAKQAKAWVLGLFNKGA